MKAIELTVWGIPKGQPRPRARRAGEKARVYDPGSAEVWKNAVALAAMHHRPKEPLDGPIRVRVSYGLPRPKRLMKKKDPTGPVRHTVKPDIDNLNKAVIDALTDIGMWRDDTLICELHAEKFYVAKDGRPGAMIRIEPIG